MLDRGTGGIDQRQRDRTESGSLVQAGAHGRVGTQTLDDEIIVLARAGMPGVRLRQTHPHNHAVRCQQPLQLTKLMQLRHIFVQALITEAGILPRIQRIRQKGQLDRAVIQLQ